MTVQGKDIPFTRGSIQVDSCELDPGNPRIQYLIGQKAGSISQEELDELVWQKDSVKALAQSIQQNGGVYEQLIVQRRGDKYRVREGNCRTVACRHLLEQYPGDKRFATMPAMIFDVDLTEEDLAVLLADMHVAGKIRWDAYEQAKHVHDLFNVYGKTYDWLSNHLRLSKSKIVELLSAYSAMTDFLVANPASGNVRKFSFFHELMKKKELREEYKMFDEFKQRFHRWLSEGRITDARQVRALPGILANPDALKALDDSGFVEASRVLIQEDPSLESDLFHAIKKATEKLKAAPVSDLQDLKSGNPQKLIMLRNLYRAIDDLATLAEIKL
ncbi:hypothetical protein KF840_17445 [bacterium]|nr:hypothetical protein [bacterium]